jgi:hypothetical protein
LIGKVEELKKMGANASKQLSHTLLKEAPDETTLPESHP